MPDATLRATLRRVFRFGNRRAVVRAGRLERIAGLPRYVTLYLPPGYDERGDRRYPVLYMQDGQNLFEGERAYIPGQSWRLHEAADRAIGERTALPMIIAGIDHAGTARIDEYTPTRDPRLSGGGRADDYARMLLEEIKPAIDARFRTIPADNAIGGSSLGGLVSLYLALEHPTVFRAAAVMSPSVWWNQRAILREVDRFDGPRPKLWVDIGAREGREALDGARALRDRLKANGWTNGMLRYHEDRRGDHSERAWARRVRLALEFLYAPA
ncbi:MAG TPA: alpha/beta hydrolase-fold protein [Thermoanaerobaculia bacterium]|nr:alpha/beta hydrolase-fold protein [Thermoanaerobaculia bacterium]